MLRPAYLAGSWYPAGAAECQRTLAQLEAACRDVPSPTRAGAGLVAPHAGWAYSGLAAARGYAALAAAQPAPEVDLAVVFGSHRGPDSGNSVSLAEGWETPLGPITCAVELAQELNSHKILQLAEEPLEPRSPDNGVELHLPFVRYFFPHAELLMLGVAPTPAALLLGEHVAQLTQRSGKKAVFIGSTDLTHYGPNYGFSPHGRGEQAVRWVREENDQAFIERLLAQDYAGALTHGQEQASACCAGAAVAAATAAACVQGAAPHLVEHYLSCDVRAADSFVGYASVLV